jgi:ribosomal protein S6--L-glutamate ligase
LRNALEKASEFERTGQKGFVIQQYIPNGNRTLRITIIGSRFISYWRVQKNVELFHSNLDKGGMIDPFADPHLQEAAIGVTRDFCRIAGINLAGFDFLFSSRHHPEIPLFLEINYFFGRRGLGGSDEYYRILIEEILLWIRGLGYECPAQLEICEE